LAKLPYTSVVIVYGGRELMTTGDVKALGYMASVRKSLLSLLYGNYVANGTLKLDQTVGELGIDDAGGLLPSEKEATVRDLLTARSGVYHPASNGGDDFANAPSRGSKPHGTYWLYNNWDFNVAGTVFERQTHKNIYDAFGADIAKPLGFKDWDRSRQHKFHNDARSIHPAYHFHLSAEDMARVGLLVLRHGTWRDRQVEPSDWIEKITTVVTHKAQMTENPVYRTLPFGYGHLWWIWDGKSARAPYRGAFTAIGALGQYITVLPELDLVVAVQTRPAHDDTPTSLDYPQLPIPEYLTFLDSVVRARCSSVPC
jgi:CubicO group peptidase (beta-lactamase class C family)